MAAADGSAVLCFFTRFRPFGVDLQKKIFTENFAYRDFRDDVINRENFTSFSEKKIVCKLTPNGLKRVKNTKLLTRLPPPTNFPFRVCYTSYHTTFHQNLSINVKFFIIILGNQFFDLKPPHNQEEANKKNLAKLVHLFQSY